MPWIRLPATRGGSIAPSRARGGPPGTRELGPVGRPRVSNRQSCRECSRFNSSRTNRGCQSFLRIVIADVARIDRPYFPSLKSVHHCRPRTVVWRGINAPIIWTSYVIQPPQLSPKRCRCAKPWGSRHGLDRPRCLKVQRDRLPVAHRRLVFERTRCTDVDRRLAYSLRRHRQLCVIIYLGSVR